MSDFLQIIRETDINALATYLRSFGVWAIVVSVLLNIVQTFGVLIPSIALSGANALVFGPLGGVAVSWLGEVIGASLSFLVFRHLIKTPVQKKFAWLTNLNNKNTFYGVLIARLIPAVPSGMVNLGFAATNITLGSFVLATALGKIPGLFLEVFLAHDLIFFSENKKRFIILLGVTLLASLGGRYFIKRRPGN